MPFCPRWRRKRARYRPRRPRSESLRYLSQRQSRSGVELRFGQLGPSQERIWSALLDENRLTHDQSVLQMLPGSESEQAVLGYLHANCAHCHNAQGSAWPDTDIELGLSVNDTLPETTAAYRTSIGQALQYFNAEPGVVRLMPGDPERSAIYLRMAQRGLETQMPPLATKHVDEVISL